MQAMTQIAMRSAPSPLVARDPAPASHYTFRAHTAHTGQCQAILRGTTIVINPGHARTNIAICTTLNTNDSVSILYHA